MPEFEAPTEVNETSRSSSSQTSLIESVQSSEYESLTANSEYDEFIPLEYAIGNSASSSESELGTYADGFNPTIMALDLIKIPLENNLKQLLIHVTGTEDLETVTSIRLRVIARDFSLQRLPIYLPHLAELNLDGSCLMSLRDLGCDLKSLVILRVSRTGLNSLDGLFGLDSLVELYAGANNIKDLSPCTTLSFLKVLDLRKNDIHQINSVSFLQLCSYLKHLTLQENPMESIENYRGIINTLLPGLETLDGINLPAEVRSIDDEKKDTNSKIISRFPPISSNSIQQKDPDKILEKNSHRPASTGSIGVLKNKKIPVRPATARRPTQEDFPWLSGNSNLNFSDIQQIFVPSTLTSGKPICGNPALTLLEKRKHKYAWSTTNEQI